MSETLADHIPESKLARFAYRVAFIPVLGIPLFMLFGTFAFFQVGVKGQTGLKLLWRGFFVILLCNVLPYFLLYFFGFFPQLYPFLPKHTNRKYSIEHYDGIYPIQNNNLKVAVYYWFGQRYKEKYYRNDQMMYQGIEDDDDIKQGIWQWWYDNGQLQEKGQYKHGIKIGTWKQWHSNGQLEYLCSFENGKENETCQEWHSNGQLSSKAKYIDGKIEGNYQEWHSNGQLRAEPSVQMAK